MLPSSDSSAALQSAQPTVTPVPESPPEPREIVTDTALAKAKSAPAATPPARDSVRVTTASAAERAPATSNVDTVAARADTVSRKPDTLAARAATGATNLASASPAASASSDSAPAAPPRKDAPAARRLPFALGERLEYQVKFGSMSVGRASMEVLGLDTVRGRQVYHTMFNVRGGVLLYKVNDRYESWFDPFTFASRRFRQDIDQGSYERERVFEIFPERAVYVENGKPEAPSVPQPLDEASFIYFLRTTPLEVGKTYDLHRYFRPDRNPVRVEVLRKERITVPAGTFNTIVVRPVIKTPGIFSEGGRAEIWFTDDSVRTMVQMKSRLKFGSLNLYLRSIHPGGAK